MSAKRPDVMAPNAEGSMSAEDQSSKSMLLPSRLWYYYRGESTTNLRYAYSDDGGTTWSGDQIFNNGIGSSTSPAVVFQYLDKFYAVYKGGSSNNIYISTSTDGMTWQPNFQIPGIQTVFAPAVSVFGGRIYVFYSAWDLMYYVSSTDGVNWTSPNVVPWSGNSGAITAAGSYLFFSDPGNNFNLNFIKAYPAAGGTLTFSLPVIVRNQQGKAVSTRTSVGVISVGANDWLIAYKKHEDSRLNIYQGCLDTLCSGGVVSWSNAYTSNGPSIINSLVGGLTIVYKSATSGTIYYGKSSDGGVTWSSNHAALGQTSNGGPRLVESY